MNADAFRHLYEYHFSENNLLWERYLMDLTEEQYTQAVGYSHGSVRDQITHMIRVDDTWFRALRGEEIPEPQDAGHLEDRAALRRQGEVVEGKMRAYLAGLRDEMLMTRPFAEGEDKDLILWQVLVHVVNHGTDHRAQVLRCLNDLGLRTAPQDYIFYVYDHP